MTYASFKTWRTTKEGKLYRAKVLNVQPLTEVNANGSYADITLTHTALFSTRAKAKGWAQRWVRYYKNKK